MNAEETLRAINPTAHLNRDAVRSYALEIAAQVRPFHKFERVSLSFLTRIEAATRRAVVEEVKKHPSKGKTLL